MALQAAGSINRIPGEFKYWDNVDSPKARVLRGALKRLFGIDPKLPDDVVRTWAYGYYDADPVAEAFVDDVYFKRGQDAGRAMVDQALAKGVATVARAPASLKRLFAEVELEPQWLDWEQVELGARVFRRFGTHMYSFAGAITLEGYRENSVAKPLAFTGAYGGESANRRFLETAQFWVDVAQPGALRPGGRGRATALRVRLMHVFVRKRLLQHPKWDLAAWGVPISQSDALLTLMGGSFVPGYGLRLLGYRTTREEIEAMMHFWRYVGHLMGVQPRWYPANVGEALGLMYTSQVKSVGRSGEDGVYLSKSYVESYKPQDEDDLVTKLVKRFEYGLQLGYVAWFVPPWTHRYYQLPKPGLWALHPLLQFPVIYVRESLRRRIPLVDAWWDRRARATAQAWVRKRLGIRRAEYKAVEAFTR